MDSSGFGKNSPFLCSCFQSHYPHCRCAVDGETDCKGWNSYNGRSEKICNSGKNECQFPGSVYTGEEKIRFRYRLQTNVKERQLRIQNDPDEIEAGIKAVDVGRKIFDLISTTRSGTHNVVDISLVQGWFRSRVLSEDFFLDMPHEQTRIIRSPPAPHRDPSRLSIEIPIERECIQCKDQFC